MHQLQRSGVRSQHPSAQWNLRGGRWSSAEYNMKKQKTKQTKKKKKYVTCSSCGTCSSRTGVQALLLITGKNTSQAKAFLIRVTYSRLRPTYSKYIISGAGLTDWIFYEYLFITAASAAPDSQCRRMLGWKQEPVFKTKNQGKRGLILFIVFINTGLGDWGQILLAVGFFCNVLPDFLYSTLACAKE